MAGERRRRADGTSFGNAAACAAPSPQIQYRHIDPPADADRAVADRSVSAHTNG